MKRETLKCLSHAYWRPKRATATFSDLQDEKEQKRELCLPGTSASFGVKGDASRPRADPPGSPSSPAPLRGSRARSPARPEGAGPAALTSRGDGPGGGLAAGGADRGPQTARPRPAAAMCDPERGWSLSFSGCGFLFPYYLGAIDCMSERAPHLLSGARHFFGSSCGSIQSVFLLGGVPLSAYLLGAGVGGGGLVRGRPLRGRVWTRTPQGTSRQPLQADASCAAPSRRAARAAPRGSAHHPNAPLAPRLEGSPASRDREAGHAGRSERSAGGGRRSRSLRFLPPAQKARWAS